MCAIVEEYAEECVEKRDKETAIQLIKLGKLTAEDIAASIPSLSVEEIIKLQESVL